MELVVNQKHYRLVVDPARMLLWVLRDELDLTGTKYGCGEGQCGACTVLMEGAPVRSCITRVSAVAGKEITTIEGLAQNGKLHPRAGSLYRSRRAAVRVLHAGHDSRERRAAEEDAAARASLRSGARWKAMFAGAGRIRGSFARCRWQPARAPE